MEKIEENIFSKASFRNAIIAILLVILNSFLVWVNVEYFNNAQFGSGLSGLLLIAIIIFTFLGFKNGVKSIRIQEENTCKKIIGVAVSSLIIVTFIILFFYGFVQFR